MSKQKILVDTSALIAFFIKTETHNQTARKYVVSYPEKEWVVLETIFDETVTWFRTRVSSQASVQLGEVLRTEHQYYYLSDSDDDAIWETFRKYDDKKWSYTDCSLLVISQRLQIPEIFAFDEHIRQMAGLGVICVPQ